MGNHSPSDIKTPIVVTGATGFIGENIIKILLEKGYNVKATVQYFALK
jgi:nucleoside-diphosphate-sugar epimerase